MSEGRRRGRGRRIAAVLRASEDDTEEDEEDEDYAPMVGGVRVSRNASTSAVQPVVEEDEEEEDEEGEAYEEGEVDYALLGRVARVSQNAPTSSGRPMVVEAEVEEEEEEEEQEEEEEDEEGEAYEEGEVDYALLGRVARVSQNAPTSSGRPMVVEAEVEEEEEEEEEEVVVLENLGEVTEEKEEESRRRQEGEASSSRKAGKEELFSSESDGVYCPICMDHWTSEGDHQASCLPCGHVYGLSCIKKWLQRFGNRSGKCPHCNGKYLMKDVRRLFVSQIVVVREDFQKKARLLESQNIALTTEICALKNENNSYKMKELSRRAETFIHTHLRKDGSPVSEDVGNKIEQMRNLMAASTPDGTSRDDIYTQIMGLDTHGRVRCCGMGVTPTKMWGSSSSCQGVDAQELNRLKEELEEERRLREEHMERFNRDMERANSEIAELQRLFYSFAGQARQSSGGDETPHQMPEPS